MKRILIILGGLLLVVAGAYILLNGSKEEKKCTKEVTATVVDVDVSSRRRSNGTRRKTYYPVIEYTAGNTKVTKKSSFSTSKKNKYTIGSKITIRYNPNNVESFVIKGEHGTLKTGIVMILAGAVISFGGFKTKAKEEVEPKKEEKNKE